MVLSWTSGSARPIFRIASKSIVFFAMGYERRYQSNVNKISHPPLAEGQLCFLSTLIQ